MASKRVARRQPGVIRRFWRETTGELRKVSWPTRREAYQLTKIVITVMIIVGAALSGLDALFTQLFKWVFS